MEPSAATLTGSVATERATEGPGVRPRGVAAELEDASAEEALRWALDTFHPRMYIAASFQKTSSVTVHMATQINPEARFFYLDTDVLFPETYETKDRLEERYGITFHRYSSMTLEQQAGLLRRPALGARPRRLLRHPQGRPDALGALGRRLLGQRHPPPGLPDAGQAPPSSPGTSASSLWKLNPLADWSEKDVWRYIARARHPLQPAARPGLSLDRLHPLHAQAGRGRGRPRGTLGGDLEDRVRAARLAFGLKAPTKLDYRYPSRASWPPPCN